MKEIDYQKGMNELKLIYFYSSMLLAIGLSLVLIINRETPSEISEDVISRSSPMDFGGLWFWLVFPILTIFEVLLLLLAYWSASNKYMKYAVYIGGVLFVIATIINYLDYLELREILFG